VTAPRGRHAGVDAGGIVGAHDDLSECTLKLREGVKFRNIEKDFTSAELKYTIERMLGQVWQ
jgi:ABC-type transport system substrate-binding protein